MIIVPYEKCMASERKKLCTSIFKKFMFSYFLRDNRIIPVITIKKYNDNKQGGHCGQ